MAYSSGTFSRLYDFTDDRDNGVRIQAARMDAELDGMATGLTTAILKDGSQTTTAVVPFAYGISIVDNQSATFGTTSDYTLQYDETTRDSLFLTSNVEGAAFKLTLAADQGDDASDEWQVGISTSGVLTIGNDIASAQTYVSQLTLTPHATVASSTTAVLGNLTVGGSLSLGSAVIAEAELEMLDGITAGTVIASKALVADANIDITGGRNITITGELAAATLDISGNIDIDGTANLDIVDIDGAVNIAATTTIDGANKVQFRDTGLYIHSSTDGQLDIVSDTKTQINSATIELTGIVNIAGLTTVTAANKIQFRDTGLYINSSTDGQLDIVADTEIQIAATTIDINGAVALNGAITGATNITLTGELDAATGDFSGDVDVDGTLEADAMQ
jgi:cytoskeletal protein CcmA (bactofilin family)